MQRTVAAVLAVAVLSSMVQAGDPGTWPQGDVLDGEWVPSRSTHYGWTNAGACGQGTAANCWSGRMDGGCDTVPEALKTPMGGLYAAPQGDYYSQVGNYVSCGECFEIKCDDPHCIKDKVITIFISDACPCLGNEKWCCNVASACEEMSSYPSIEGPPHCPKLGGPWDARSVHLDLSNYAFALLEKGDRTLSPDQGFLNTFMRRVTCPNFNNSIYLTFAAGAPIVSTSCVLGGNGMIRGPCFYFIMFGVLGMTGPGAVARVQYLGKYSVNQTVYDGPYELEVVDRPGQDPQGRYGAWSAANNIALVLPFRLRFWSRMGESAESIDFTPDMFAKLVAGDYLDTKAQFGWTAPPPAPTPTPVAASTAAAPVVPTGPKPVCFSSAIDQGANDWYFAFQVSVEAGHTIASVHIVGNGQNFALTGPNNWGPSYPTVYTAQSPFNYPFPLPFELQVTDTAGNVNMLPVTTYGRDTVKYTC